MMSKFIYFLCLLVLPIIGTSYAADSVITITGNVQGNTCLVSTGSQDFTVDLMTHASRQFSSVGSVTTSVPFSIILSSCGAATTAVKVGFTGTADSNNTSLLKLDPGAGNASQMGIQILDNTKNTIPLNAPSSALSWIPLTATQSNTLNFYARLMATQIPVGAGIVSSTATFTLEFQ
jgi:minor fimbrial subunit